MAKVIFHIDLNAYFASAEIARNSALEGLPVVVGGLQMRSVICAASYEARKYGVYSAMPLHEAYKRCPDLVVIEGDHEYYKHLSKRFFDFVRTFSAKIEIASIDECYVDMSETIKQYKRPLDLAWQIQQQLKDTLHLTCSIGIGPTKFLAKMASDRYKPMGIYVIRKQEIPNKLWPLPIREMHGIGKKTAPILERNHIQTIHDLVKSENRATVERILGKNALATIMKALGQSSDTIEYSQTLQSISQSTTSNHDMEDYNEIMQTLQHLAKKLAQRAQSKLVRGKLISISIRYHDFRNAVRSIQLDHYVNDYSLIYEHAISLFDEYDEEKPVRHLGITLGSLQSNSQRFDQISLFEAEQKQVNILDELNKELEGKPLVFASSLLEGK